MRIASLSFFLYSLSLVAVTAGQNNVFGDIGDLVAPSSNAATTTESSSSSETESATTSESSPTAESTPTSTSDSSTSTSDSSSSTDSSTTDSSTTPTSTSDATTTTDASTTGTSDSSSSTANVVTTIQTISGTPVPTTSTSSSPDATNAPGLNESSGSSDSGLSSSDKKVIIGVVVGVGGAIVLAVIGIVIWRIRSKKNSGNDPDEAADLMSGTPIGAGAREKAPSPGAHGAGANAGGTPFRSTLDQYHNPGPVNAAANF